MKVASLLLLCASLVTVGCAKKVAVHPGAVSNLDSYAYDVLLVEQDAISNAKAAFLAGSLPANSKDPLNAAIKQYDITLGAWQGYHGGLTTDATILQNAVDALIGAVAALEQSMGKQVPQSAGKLSGNIILTPMEVAWQR